MTHFDLAIIGSGSGNTIATKAMSHWRVAIIEESTFGGTCLNVGCIPTKMYVYAADLVCDIRDSDRLGIDASVNAVRWGDIRDRVFGRIDPISASGRAYRTSISHNTTLFEAHASFKDERTLELSDGRVITADRIVIATGSRPMIPTEVLESGVPYETSATVMRMDALPKRMIILGGGYIATEFAHVFASFGTAVTLVVRSSPLLRQIDLEIAERFTALVSTDWDVRLDAHVRAAARTADGVRLDLVDGSQVEGDVLLVATGRTPNSDALNLAAAGVDAHADGRIIVDCHQRTSADGIWALGDVCSPHQLKHVSNHEARVVQHNLLHPDDLMQSDHRFVPSAVFTDPQIASVGVTEEAAKASGRPYVTAVRQYGSTAYGWAMEDTTSVCKLIADPSTGLLIGAHIMGDEACDLIQPVIQAMSFGLTVKEMARGQYWIHPALIEVVENALLELPIP